MNINATLLPLINTKMNRLKIALAMEVTEQAVKNYISRNDVKLTQAAPLKIIERIAEDNGLTKRDVLTARN